MTAQTTLEIIIENQIDVCAECGEEGKLIDGICQCCHIREARGI